MQPEGNMVHATSVCHPMCVAPAGQCGSDSTAAIPATSRLAAGAGVPKAGAGSAEGPPN